MLELEDYLSIAGCQLHHTRMLRDACEAWLSKRSNAEISRQFCLINSAEHMSTWTKAGLKR
jgi:hypothetical protein